MLKQFLMTVSTNGRGFTEITSDVAAYVKEINIKTGLCHVFIQHTSASLIICENADPQVLQDLSGFMLRLVPDGDPLYQHTDEGDDDMPAHVRMVLTQTSLIIPVVNGKLALGRWQGVFVWEHRFQPHERRLVVTISGK
jgi:secondary thiamine-phosphate synthase enzyme